MIFINNCFIDTSESDYLIQLDSAYQFGLGVFETILIKNNYPEYLSLHLDRLNSGLKKLNIQPKYNLTIELINKSISHFSPNYLENKYILKIIISDKNLIISHRKFNYTEADYHQGFRLQISDIRKNQSSPLTYIKSINYTENILARNLAYDAYYNDCLFLNTENQVTETSIANIFLIKNDQIYTPTVESGLLNGIIRQVLIAKKQELNIQEKILTLDDFATAEGVFLTNSVFKLMPVNKINNVLYPINHNFISKIADLI